METRNVISTPNITGNIGSCRTSVVEQATGRGFWAQDLNVIATNSCTGQQTTTQTWEMTGIGGTIIIVPILFILFLLFAMADRD